MEFLQLKYFCSAAKTQNFSQTAQIFSVPASNISQCIKRLENEVGKQLFERKSNKIILNENGAMFYEKVSTALSLIESATADLTSSNAKKTISICVLTNRQFVMNLTENFLNEFPDVSVVISHDYNFNEHYDIIIADEDFKNNNMIKKLIITERIMLAMNKANENSHKDVLTLEELKNENFVGLDSSSSLYHTSEKIANTLNFSPKYVIQSPDPYYVRKCVELNLGVAFVPTISWKGLFNDSVILKNIGNFERKTYAYISNQTYREWSDKLIRAMSF